MVSSRLFAEGLLTQTLGADSAFHLQDLDMTRPGGFSRQFHLERTPASTLAPLAGFWWSLGLGSYSKRAVRGFPHVMKL